MSCGSTCTKPHTRPLEPAEAATPHLLSPAEAIAFCCVALVALQIRWRRREELRELDDRILRDVGLTRWEVERERRRPSLLLRHPRA